MSDKDGDKHLVSKPEVPMRLRKSSGFKKLKNLARNKNSGSRCARNISTLKTGSHSSVRARSCESQRPVMIDPLEQRLLYSADHPLGLAISAADIHDDLAQFDDVQLISALLDELHQQPLSDTATPRMLDTSILGPNEIFVTTFVDTLDGDTSTFENFNEDVGNDDKVSLREAIQVANGDETVGRIILQDGTYILSLEGSNPGEDRNQDGDLDVEGTFLIQGVSEGNTTIMQSVEGTRAFELQLGEVSFADLAISGYVAEGANEVTTVGTSGAAVFVQPLAVANFSNVTLSQNISSAEGGALYIAGEANLDNVKIFENLAENEGGGIYLDENAIASLTGVSSITDNTSLASGGGIHSDGSLTINGGVISNNNVSSENSAVLTLGGGLYISDTGEANISSVNISANTAESGGAGIYTAGLLRLSDSSVFGQDSSMTRVIDSGRGAGIYIADTGHGILTRVGVVGNNAIEEGGGIYNLGTLETLDGTLESNSAVLGGGIYNMGTLDRQGGSFNSNIAEQGGGIYNGGFANLQAPVFNDNSAVQEGGGIYNLSTLEMVDGSLNRNSAEQGGGIYNEGFAELQKSAFNENNAVQEGGGIYNLSTLEIIDGSLNNNRADQGGGIYNQGALKLQGTAVNNNKAANGGGIYNDGAAELTDANFFSNEAAQGGAVYNKGGSDVPGSGLDTLQVGLVITTDVLFSGNKAEQGGGIYSEGGLYIDDVNFESNVVSAETITNELRGGGAYIADGNAEIRNSTFSKNTAPSSGAGIHNEAVLTLLDSALISNVAGTTGGGLANVGSGNATLDRVAIWGNESQGSTLLNGGGGGIYNGPNAMLDVNYSIVANNKSEQLTAGILSFGTAFIDSSRILSNASTAGSVSGGIGAASLSSTGRIVTLTNSVVANNTSAGESSDVLAIGENVSSGGFNLVETAENFNALGTDIIDIDPGFGATPTDELPTPSDDLDPGKIYLIDNQVQYIIDDDSPTLYSGGETNPDDITIDGSPVGVLPHIGGFTHTVSNGKVFWTSNNGNIFRSDTQFTFSQLIVDSTAQPLDIEVDAEAGRIYWLDSTSNAIVGANFDGSDIETVQVVDVNAVEFVTDKEHERFFTLVNSDSSSVVQYFYSQTSTSEAAEQQGSVVYTSDNTLKALALDKTDDVLYWAEAEGSDSARIISLETEPLGTDPQVSVAQTLVGDPAEVNNPSSITIIELADQLFWAEPDRQALVRFDENSTQQTLAFEYDSQPVPQSIVYDNVDDRILVAGQQQFVYEINPELEESSLVGTVPETIDDLAYALINESPTFVAVPTLSVSEGETLPLDNMELQVSDVNTDDAEVLFVIRGQAGGVVWANGSALDLQSTFTLAQLKSGMVEYQHAGGERSSGGSYIELGIRDEQSELISIPRIDIEVTPVNDSIPVAQDQVATGKHNTTIDMVVTADGGTASTLLHGVIDADLPDDNLSVIVDDTPMDFGTLTVNEDGSFAYIPLANLDRGMQFEESFQYHIVDAADHLSEAATVSIVIQALEAPRDNRR